MRQTLRTGDVARGAVAGGNAKATDHAVVLSSTVPACAAAISLLRNAIRGFADSWRMEGWGPASFDEDRAADMALVFTELLTNAVLHSGCAPDDALVVRLALVGDRSRGSVTDRGPGFSTEPGAVTPRVDGGLGLFIVGRLARAWGVKRVDAGNEVWFEF